MRVQWGKFARKLKTRYLPNRDTSSSKAASREKQLMKSFNLQDRRQKKVVATCVMTFVLVVFVPLIATAQNLGGAPATNKAVQGQTAAQPEGAFLNLVNWIGNVIAPVGAVLCVVMAVVNYTHGRGVARWAVAAGGLLLVSGLTRLIEFWIAQGTAGV
jgi:hypothetical protein